MALQPEPNSLHDFTERLTALLDEARSHGIRSACVLYEDDLITETEAKTTIWRGGALLCGALFDYGRRRLADSMHSGELDAE